MMKRFGWSLLRAGNPSRWLASGGVIRIFHAMYLSGCMKHDTQWSASSSKKPALFSWKYGSCEYDGDRGAPRPSMPEYSCSRTDTTISCLLSSMQRAISDLMLSFVRRILSRISCIVIAVLKNGDTSIGVPPMSHFFFLPWIRE